MRTQRLPLYAPPAVDVERRSDGTLILRSPTPIGELGRSMNDDLVRWAQAEPARVFLAQRTAAGIWRELTYGAARNDVRAIAQGLLQRGASAERPVAIVAENGIDHALVALAAMEIGVPVSPISTAYARAGSDGSRLRDILAQLTPALLFVDDRVAYAGALDSLEDIAIVDDITDLRCVPTAAVDTAAAAVTAETIAKILFTSGSTGSPKGVMTPQRMLRANQRSISHTWPFYDAEPPVLVDWLPWHHCFGGNKLFNLVLHRGGTMYVDEGKPLPELFEKTLANLREIAPTAYFGVPRAYALLVPALERDAALRRTFYSRVRLVFNAGAALHESLFTALAAIALGATDRVVPVTAAWGSTETAPLATGVHDYAAGPDNIGLPVPGVDIKLAPVDGRFEIRVRGASVMPGYWRNPEATAAAFDEEGFYRTGDAAALLDDSRPVLGLGFGGRIAENFKLTSGTWVNSGALRLALVEAAAPLVIDAVLTGADGEEVGALLFLDVSAARTLANAPAATIGDLRALPVIRERIAAALATLNARAQGSSQCVRRALIVADLPSRTEGEMTDKGSINQRVALRLRAAEAKRLHATPRDQDIIVPA
ncbi:MAG: feruloyl-CoA synthase [Candidatus Velthaea sp.]